MIQDIESGKINCVITKDLSRLGRNYIETGQYLDYFFPNNNVRYIAVNEGIDTEKDDNDIVPFKNILNEMYSKDISRKVRSAKKIMSEQGKFVNSRAPYGYKKSAENKHLLAVDENVAHIIVRIFGLYIGGMTGRAIADLLNRKGVPSPNEYYYKTINKPNPIKNSKNSWCSATIMNFIKNPVYYGAMANGKREVVSFKNKRIVRKLSEEWIIIENTHEPIISKEKWLDAQRIHSTNKKDTVRRSANGEVSIFAGIIKCVDCGANMIFNRKQNKNYLSEFYRCGTYTQHGKAVCSMHKIDYHVLYEVVLSDIQRYAVLAVEDEQRLIDRILKSNDEFNAKNLTRYAKSIRESKNRIREIDGLMQSLFEEKVSGTVSQDMFKRMAVKYEGEQQQLIADLDKLEREFTDCKRVNQDLTVWIERIKGCLSIDTVTRAIAVELIDRIEVSQEHTENGEKIIDVNIFYKFGLKNSSHEEEKEIEPVESLPTKTAFHTNSIA
jgi:DNA invertase Pin-like site-specific DNA recombinase